MIALQISPKIKSLYGLGRQATKFEGFVICMEFATFARLPFGQFSAKTLKLDRVAFQSNISEMFRLDFQSNQNINSSQSSNVHKTKENSYRNQRGIVNEHQSLEKSSCVFQYIAILTYC